MDDFQGSAVLMHTSAQLMALLPSQGPKHFTIVLRLVALPGEAAAVIAVHMQADVIGSRVLAISHRCCPLARSFLAVVMQ
jgi:hypothetical protein